MADVHMSTALRNALLDQIETTIGTSAKIRIRSGAKPANVATASTGTLLAEITLASDWAGAASGGVKSFTSTPLTDSSADASGTAGYWELLTSGGTVHMRGDCGTSGSGKSMILSTLAIVSGQPFSVLSWSMTAPHAGD